MSDTGWSCTACRFAARSHDRLSRELLVQLGTMSKPRQPGWPRAVAILAGFLTLTLPLMPVQALFLAINHRKWTRAFPHWYHRQVCRLLGIRLHIDGELAKGAVLLVSNHSSWLDIPVVSAVAPVSFVAKREVSTWPLVSWLARLQRSVFVDRQRRTAVGEVAGEIFERLTSGDVLVLFAEGTSSDGNRVLPFKTSLFAAAKPSKAVADTSPAPGIYVQTLAVVYTHLHGVPLARSERPLVGWYGDMELASHAWRLLAAGPLDAHIRIGPPVPLETFSDRKALARYSEGEVRTSVASLLRGSSTDARAAKVTR